MCAFLYFFFAIGLQGVLIFWEYFLRVWDVKNAMQDEELSGILDGILLAVLSGAQVRRVL